jgi:hypothetical protein
MSRSSARLASGVVALFILAGCAAAPDRGSDFAGSCGARGLTPGSDAYTDCVERLRLQQRMDLDQIRQARELDRGSSRL